MSLDSSVKKEFMGHPMGLFILFFTEMWERFSYYGMRGILTLYIAASASAVDPGLGWSSKDAIWLYGWYTMLVYVASIPGGWIADKFLGQKKTVLYGGLLLCLGHGVMAIPQDWAFFTGLTLIILGVGGLKPNISTMVGGLYEEGDIRRDSGFTIFYIGINIGAFLASITVGLVAYYYGWHYGFGLAGIGMLLGQAVYMWGQKYLVGVGEFSGGDKVSEAEKEAAKRPLTKIEKDRVIVLLISFLIVIVFWGAFEQAGGLMNLYTDTKIDRTTGLSWMKEIPAAVFQSLNAAYIIIFGTAIGAFWVWWKKKGRESSSLFKMAVGTIIMGLGYIFMMFASQEASSETFGKAAMFWIFLAYLFHTIGELSTSPVSLSFITKLAPLKYASIMMGVYFAATGFGNKLAGSIGESSQLSPYEGVVVAEKGELITFMEKDTMEVKNDKNKVVEVVDYRINEDKTFEIKSNVYLEGNQLAFTEYETQKDLNSVFDLKGERVDELKNTLEENKVTQENPYHARLVFEKDGEYAKDLANKGDGKNYNVSFVLEEEQNEQEFNTFMWLTIFTVSFGLLLIILIKRLKKLTHGAEDKEIEKLEQEGYDIADEDIN
ncbi:peptide MFS transporter [Brumimicrobium aurantiacum]|uniref:MFS transporter n=1 Tax=Brumimicrobium aurantiacum TaxID=1737063 RepID=A0A3E1F0S1_9FLAO|nr:peptide MFS transporter [Brumimicrobium aurantiacum]RFC55408.1 MFS transporter [Brumimicrobium aurantiacum]